MFGKTAPPVPSHRPFNARLLKNSLKVRNGFAVVPVVMVYSKVERNLPYCVGEVGVRSVLVTSSKSNRLAQSPIHALNPTYTKLLNRA
jgi:hypothetical protein